MTSATRFTLEPRRWYAMKHVLPEGGRHDSPIYVYEARPLGQRRIEVTFFHAIYPEGVQRKSYVVDVMSRAPGYLAGLKRNPEGQNLGLLLLTPLDLQWIRMRFPHYKVPERADL